jgi:hypothetical protein
MKNWELDRAYTELTQDIESANPKSYLQELEVAVKKIARGYVRAEIQRRRQSTAAFL